MKKLKVLSLVAVLALVVALPAAAAEFVAPSGKNGNITFAQGETHRNLYTAGGNVTVNSNITGDLFAAGGMVTVNGTVEQDLVVGGGNVNVNGSVGGDLRVGGGNVNINSPVAGDLLVGGGNVSLSDKTTVGGDLTIGSGNVTIDGPVKGNVKIGGGMIFINSAVTGSVEVMSNDKLVFGPKSVVKGKIVYKGPVEAEVQQGAQVSVIDYTHVGKRGFAKEIAALATVGYLIKLIAMFLAAWLLIYLWPAKTQGVVSETHHNFLKNLGWGVVTLVAIPAVSAILMITGIGFLIGLVLIALYVLMMLFTGILTPTYIGALVWSWYKKHGPVATWQTALLGVVITMILGWIPFVGGLICFVFFLAVLGTISTHLYHKRAEEKSAHLA